MSHAYEPACWKAQDAEAIFLTEALEGDDSVFLATHSAIEGFDIGGRDAHEIGGANERAVLEALIKPGRTHAFCVVNGEPGSGKSHLIRWLSLNWRQKGDIKLLLRRADGSLEGALRQLKDRLPAEFAPLFDNLGQVHNATLKGRANNFLSNLANTLEPDHFETQLVDAEWCSAHRPGDLLGHIVVKKGWTAPGRILRLLEGAEGGRNSETASFDLWDIEKLAKLSTAVLGTGVPPRVEELVRRLVHEADTLEAYREANYTSDQAVLEAGSQIKRSVELLEALNRRRNDAIQSVLGVSAAGLKALFRNVRKILHQRGERLVLLLEDITSWEGLDDSLIDVLVFNAGARGDESDDAVCPLISVVGVTPNYYRMLQGNYKQRITHEIVLGQSSGGLQDVASLRESSGRQRFVSRYLSAVRAGTAKLKEWRQGLDNDPNAPPPNECIDCPRKPNCFAIFGDDDGRGLFPFTPLSIDRFFEALKDNDNNQTHRTPRGILQGVLNPNLAQAALLDKGTYPGPLIERDYIRADRRSDRLGNRLNAMIEASVPATDQARMQRVVAYWANPERADTTEVNGQLCFAGASQKLFEAFNLPWIGSASADPNTKITAPAAPVLVPAATLAPNPISIDPPTGDTVKPILSAYPRVAPTVRTGSVLPIPRRVGPTRSELEAFQDQLRGWSPGTAIDNASTWNKFLYELVLMVDAQSLGISPWLFSKLATADMVKLEGTTTRPLNYLIVANEPWVKAGFEAYISLSLDKQMSGAEAVFHRRSIAIMIRRLEVVAKSYLDRILPKLTSSARWSPAPSLAQILLVRGWLRGMTRADAPLAEQLTAILSDESEATTDPKSRCTPWDEWLSSTKDHHDNMRATLREMVSLSIGGREGGAGLTDLKEIADAIIRLRDTGRLDEVPTSDGGLPAQLISVRKIAETSRDRLAFIDRHEVSQERNRAETLDSLLRNAGVTAHLTRLDEKITQVSKLLPSAAHDRVTNWKSAYERARVRIQDGASERVEAFIEELDDPGPPTSLTTRIGWLGATPAKDLAELLSLAQLGEQVIEVLYDHVKDCIGEASGTASLGRVKAVGTALQTAAKQLLPTQVEEI